jgi:WD40 repeat protein
MNEINSVKIKEANFYGPNSEFILSGSDDGRLIVWNKETQDVIFVAKGDEVISISYFLHYNC